MSMEAEVISYVIAIFVIFAAGFFAGVAFEKNDPKYKDRYR